MVEGDKIGDDNVDKYVEVEAKTIIGIKTQGTGMPSILPVQNRS